MGGKNGTELNGTAIVERTVLQDKDQIGVSGFTLTFHKSQPTLFMAPGQTPEAVVAAAPAPVAPAAPAAPVAPPPAAPQAAPADGNATIIAPAGGAGATVIMPPGSAPTALIDPSQAVPYTLMCTAGPLQGQMFNYPGGEITLGREPGNTLVLSDHLVSRHHAKVSVQDRKVMLVDLQAGNGTFVNGQRVTMHPLNHGETITIGSSSFQFQLQGAATSAAPSGAKKSPLGLLVGVAVVAAVVVGAIVTKDKWMGGSVPVNTGPGVALDGGDTKPEVTPADAGQQAIIDAAVAAALAEKDAAAAKLAVEKAAADKAAADVAAAAKVEADKVAMAAKDAAAAADAEKAAMAAKEADAEAEKVAMAAQADAAAKAALDAAAADKAAADKVAMEAAAAAKVAAATATATPPAGGGGDAPDVNGDFDAAKAITLEGGLERAKLAE